MRRYSGEEFDIADVGPCLDDLRPSIGFLLIFLVEFWPPIPVIGVLGPVLNTYYCGAMIDPIACREVVPLIVLIFG